MPAINELTRHDPRMRNLLLVGAIFLFLTPILFYFQDPFGWSGKDDYLLFLLFGLGAPFLLIAAMLMNRRRKLRRLAEGGLRVAGIVEKTRSTREGRRATVRFHFRGAEHLVDLEVPAHCWGIDEGATATLLVDPDKPQDASLLEVRGDLAHLLATRTRSE